MLFVSTQVKLKSDLIARLLPQEEYNAQNIPQTWDATKNKNDWNSEAFQ